MGDDSPDIFSSSGDKPDAYAEALENLRKTMEDVDPEVTRILGAGADLPPDVKAILESAEKSLEEQRAFFSPPSNENWLTRSAKALAEQYRIFEPSKPAEGPFRRTSNALRAAAGLPPHTLEPLPIEKPRSEREPFYKHERFPLLAFCASVLLNVLVDRPVVRLLFDCATMWLIAQVVLDSIPWSKWWTKARRTIVVTIGAVALGGYLLLPLGVLPRHAPTRTVAAKPSLPIRHAPKANANGERH